MAIRWATALAMALAAGAAPTTAFAQVAAGQQHDLFLFRSKPGVLGLAGTPGGQPTSPGAPGTPVTPVDPETPETPEVPEVPEVPVVPVEAVVAVPEIQVAGEDARGSVAASDGTGEGYVYSWSTAAEQRPSWLSISEDGAFSGTTAYGVWDGLVVKVVDSEGNEGLSAPFSILVRDPALVAWGTNTQGSLGVGSSSTKTVPTAVVAPEGGFRGLNAWYRTSCALTASGSVACWGNNAEGNVGDGSVTDRRSPTVVTSGATFVKVRPSYFATCAIRSDGRAMCWGKNSSGELGRGTVNTVTANRSPALVGGSEDVFSDIAVAHSTTCGIVAGTGRVKCWGDNASSKRGHPYVSSTRYASTPTFTGFEDAFTSIEAASGTFCGISTTGGVKCWGDGASGVNGNGSAAASAIPVDVVNTGGAARLFGGGSRFCVLMPGGQARCWGTNGSGALGIGTADNAIHAAATPVLGGISFKEMSNGYFGIVGVGTDGRLWYWGGGQGEIPSANGQNVTVPTEPFPDRRFQRAAAGAGYIIALE